MNVNACPDFSVTFSHFKRSRISQELFSSPYLINIQPHFTDRVLNCPDSALNLVKIGVIRLPIISAFCTNNLNNVTEQFGALTEEVDGWGICPQFSIRILSGIKVENLLIR